MRRILVIDDDPDLLDNVLELLELEGFDSVGASDGKAGVAAALSRTPDLIVCDVSMPIMDGHKVLRAIRDYPETCSVPFIFLTARARRADVRQGMNLGADDYLTKPFSRVELLEAIRSRLERHQSLRSTAPVPSSMPADADSGPIIRSDALRATYDEALRVARTDLAVLVLGETGVGKDVLAHAIHKASPRVGAPFIPMHCAALAESLMESELFGHEKGAFTGAAARRAGLFESADGGTAFLDEIGELTPATQVKLLRVLESRQVMRVGGRSYIDVDVRFVSATNRDLQAEVDAGRFRSDLFYRIGVVKLTVPPLRERRADIAPLAERFARGMGRRMGRAEVPSFTEEALRALEAWRWPGNVRELRNTIERCVALSSSAVVDLEHLPDDIRSPTPEPEAPPTRRTGGGGDVIADLKQQQWELERARILRVLEEHGGNQTRTARALGISRRTLINRLDEYGVPRPRK